MSKLTGDDAAALAEQASGDRRELALTAVERTHMPMVVSDTRLPDMPIVLANGAFLALTGYAPADIIGRNCRFLQGPDTDRKAVSQIRDAVRRAEEFTITLLNYRKDGSPFWNELHGSPIRDDDGKLIYFFASQRDVTEQRRVRALEIAEHALMMEVDHRAKNALALVQGIVRLSQAEDVASFSAAVQGRVDALALAHNLLSEQRWRGVALDAMVSATAARFDETRISGAGPNVTLTAEQAQPLALVLHELISNAARHGALSQPEGKVEISWRAENGSVAVEIIETGGPEPALQRQRGFGSSLLDGVIRQLRGRAAFDWRSDGLHSLVTIPWLSRAAA